MDFCQPCPIGIILVVKIILTWRKNWKCTMVMPYNNMNKCPDRTIVRVRKYSDNSEKINKIKDISCFYVKPLHIDKVGTITPMKTKLRLTAKFEHSEYDQHVYKQYQSNVQSMLTDIIRKIFKCDYYFGSESAIRLRLTAVCNLKHRPTSHLGASIMWTT